ncbi:Arc family DNA-binding protein [Acinetobacter johnsonii]|jgi:predicted DNA-binding protein|uniref:Arc family DNA-binding protein n=1 Tax=Acinetobacter johnsonii TaxID=40214 RepID=A0AA42LCI4_ACIJO|nr:Arc family DNA-binding protein [Acinetobacter johnsonii]MDN5621591.1 Arc family DNA-binding protein [Acinetobacter sp.]NWK63775.1 Arc family DNA-binding protein [Acinetobacter sp. SwsAc3]MDH0655017.1 Arc family DNA-binding protein [Acinetobacter johnsonii]PZO86744.1 MAG: hypothetical protein DI631_15855 [Acinetobacter johnsonii]HRM51204.1 Arc family DNA-binding protein [Acinetobacter johnsonii]
MARTDQQFPLRLPPELKEKLENACKESGRSKNAEAVYRLEQSFEHQENSDIAQLKQQIERMDQTIKTLATTLQSVANRGK